MGVGSGNRLQADLAGSAGATESSHYPAIQGLLKALLRELDLSFDVRVNTSERRKTGGKMAALGAVDAV
jgi:hypothetical protein